MNLWNIFNQVFPRSQNRPFLSLWIQFNHFHHCLKLPASPWEEIQFVKYGDLCVWRSSENYYILYSAFQLVTNKTSKVFTINGHYHHALCWEKKNFFSTWTVNSGYDKFEHSQTLSQRLSTEVMTLYTALIYWPIRGRALKQMKLIWALKLFLSYKIKNKPITIDDLHHCRINFPLTPVILPSTSPSQRPTMTSSPLCFSRFFQLFLRLLSLPITLYSFYSLSLWS